MSSPKMLSPTVVTTSLNALKFSFSSSRNVEPQSSKNSPIEANDFLDCSKYSLLDFEVHVASVCPTVVALSVLYFSNTGLRRLANCLLIEVQLLSFSGILSMNQSSRLSSSFENELVTVLYPSFSKSIPYVCIPFMLA